MWILNIQPPIYNKNCDKEDTFEKIKSETNIYFFHIQKDRKTCTMTGLEDLYNMYCTHKIILALLMWTNFDNEFFKHDGIM